MSLIAAVLFAVGACFAQTIEGPLLPPSQSEAFTLTLDAPAQLPAARPELVEGLPALTLSPLSAALPLQAPLSAAPLRAAVSDLRSLPPSDVPGLGERLDAFYSGSAPAASAPELPALEAASWNRRAHPRDRGAVKFVVNDDGVPIFGRAAVYYKEAHRLAGVLQSRGVDLSESLDVMDDAYADVWAKLTTIEKVAGRHGVEDANVHLPWTLTWADGVIEQGRRRIAIHTHRVFFHKAPTPSSEINEGIRRVGGFLWEAVRQFERGGKAEREVGRLDKVVLAFDTRGYSEIKDFLVQKEAELNRTHPGRFEFEYVDELSRVPRSERETREELGRLTRRYQGQEKGVGKIIEGVIYSRYVGLLLELKTLEHFSDLGYRILQSGRELFDENGHYVTELDAVVQSPGGRISVVEAKSARVALPVEEALRSKIAYKLETYKRNRLLMEKAVGGPFDVVFSVDVGANDAFASYLQAKKTRLEAEYGFKLDFVFLESGPEQESPRRDKRRRRR